MFPRVAAQSCKRISNIPSITFCSLFEGTLSEIIRVNM